MMVGERKRKGGERKRKGGERKMMVGLLSSSIHLRFRVSFRITVRVWDYIGNSLN